MGTRTLGRLQKVELREVWTSESSDFTPWLAQEENLKLLGEAISIELELESLEKEVGPFRADILCKDTATDNWVLIENQLERTDHPHLGQLLTYAAGLNAVTIVWIAERFTEEHRTTLDWLNERTDDKINLFGLEIELWRIGDSPIAPKFNIISQPNDWSRTVQQAAAAGGEVSAHKQLQLKFWTAFKQYMETEGSFIRCQKPLPQHWTNHAIGRSGVHLTSIVSLWNSETGVKGPEIRAELYMDGPSAKQEFASLEKQKEGIENALGFALTWHNPENKAMCRLYTRQNADFLDEALWPQQFEWLKQRLETMHKVFGPIVKNMKPVAAE
ncbi:DUF4268 domain-containing protein [Candidatus Methylomirabilis sp.]|uniref:DUF4268 domain-containing protein n=1 Tax=Candidatus Methylomirabilis sp. TaxID=2032687 RepID=UPI003C775B58